MSKELGSVTWWGFSPAIDIMEYYNMTDFTGEVTELNVLVIGGGDIRHILKTIAQKGRHHHKTKKSFNKIHFHVIETNLELYARSMMLFSLALESPQKYGLQEKVELFAEIFGNTLLRSQASSHVQAMANEFVKMVTDFDVLSERLPMFNLENLKYKERDMLEGIFKMWRMPDSKVFDIEQSWDLRVRHHLGTRYDASKGAFDWDYSMKLCDRGAEIISSRNYQRWRQSGVAFELREGTYDVPNKTLASGKILMHEGERHARRGYWGDIVISPYISYGIDCSDESYFKKANREYVFTSENVTEYNLTSLFHELQTGERYVPPEIKSGDSKTDPAMTSIGEEDEEPEEASAGQTEVNQTEVYEYIKCDNVTISYLPLQSLPDIANKSKYSHKFNTVFFSNSMVHHLVKPIENLFADECMVVLETAKYITELSREQYIEFTNKIDRMAKDVGCETMIDVNPEKDATAFYKFKRT